MVSLIARPNPSPAAWRVPVLVLTILGIIIWRIIISTKTPHDELGPRRSLFPTVSVDVGQKRRSVGKPKGHKPKGHKRRSVGKPTS